MFRLYYAISAIIIMLIYETRSDKPLSYWDANLFVLLRSRRINFVLMAICRISKNKKVSPVLPPFVWIHLLH